MHYRAQLSPALVPLLKVPLINDDRASECGWGGTVEFLFNHRNGRNSVLEAFTSN